MNQNANRKTATRLMVVAVAMFGFGYALVPLYDLICDVTGLNGKTQRIEAADKIGIDRSRVVTVQFVAQTNSNLPWEFRPVQNKITVHPGERTVIHYIARNKSEHPVTGRAIPSVAPSRAAAHFKKIECFCFTEQTLQAGESREMPVEFVLDPKLAPEVESVTLAYSFFNLNKQAAEKDSVALASHSSDKF